MIKHFKKTADVRMKVTMKRNYGFIRTYEDCHISESPFGRPGWIGFWVPRAEFIGETLVQVSLDKVDKIEMYDFNDKASFRVGYVSSYL